MRKFVIFLMVTILALSVFTTSTFASYKTYGDAQGTRGRATIYYTHSTCYVVSSMTTYLSSMSGVSSWKYSFYLEDTAWKYNNYYSGVQKGEADGYNNLAVNRSMGAVRIDHDWWYTISGTQYHRYRYNLVL